MKKHPFDISCIDPQQLSDLVKNFMLNNITFINCVTINVDKKGNATAKITGVKMENGFVSEFTKNYSSKPCDHVPCYDKDDIGYYLSDAFLHIVTPDYDIKTTIKKCVQLSKVVPNAFGVFLYPAEYLYNQRCINPDSMQYEKYRILQKIIETTPEVK